MTTLTMYDSDERFEYLLEQNLPHPVIAALMRLCEDSTLLREVWLVWSVEEYGLSSEDDFVRIVERIVEWDAGLVRCEGCSKWEWDDETCSTYHGHLCSACSDSDSWQMCYECDDYFPSDEVTWAAGYAYCDRRCRDEYLYYCDQCEEYDRNQHEHEPQGCDCEAIHQSFAFPANGHGTVLNDERLRLTLPAGVIDETGQNRIVDVLYNHGVGWDVARKAVDAIGDLWQSKRGNYTRRLSRELYATHGIKMADHAISEVGNVARQHSSTVSDWQVEFTRDLNQSAEAFCHADSCWFQSYWESRCALKSWGGLGLRAFDDDNNPIGRAWVQPMRIDEMTLEGPKMTPTHDAAHADAYVVYNCYGVIDEYKATRIVAHLTSKTYKRVSIRSMPQYINGDFGYLVADEAIVQQVETVVWNYSSHDLLDAHTYQTNQTNESEVTA